MAERYWEHRVPRRHVYIDETGRVIGRLYERLADAVFEAHAHGRFIGEYVNHDIAVLAVKQICLAIEDEERQAALRQAAKAATQADGTVE